jgi:ribosomal protein S18 acetylase RimI-like enzyme
MTTVNPTFSRAGRNSLEQLLALMAEFYAGEALPYDEALARKGLDLLFTDESLGRAWFIEVEGECAGYLVLAASFSLEFHGRDAFVDELYVRPAYRGRGLGTHALERAMAECRALGIHALHLEVDHDNPQARALYERLGFVDHDRHLMTKWLLDE